MVILGIDPDRGWALAIHEEKCTDNRFLRSNKQILAAGSEKGVEPLTAKIRELAREVDIDQVRVERPANKNVYDRPGQNVRAMKKVAVNVGENRAKAEWVYWFCQGLGLDVQYVNPVRHGTKLNQKQIERLTGWTGRTNEHSRDAIVIAWC